MLIIHFYMVKFVVSYLISSVIYLNFDHTSVYKVYTVEFVVFYCHLLIIL